LIDKLLNDVTTNEQGKTFWDKLNLPQVLGGAAGTAISRLISDAVEIPSAWLQGKVEGIKDNTRAKSVIAASLASEVANQAAANPNQVNRATARWLGEITRKQVNREEVAKKTVEYLDGTPANENSTPVDDDWLDYFSSYAERANSDKMKDLWARVLAGEIRASGSYSLETIRFMSELDHSIALIIEKYFSRVFEGKIIFDYEEYHKGQSLTETTLLENKGLLNGVGGLRNYTFQIGNEGLLFLKMRKHKLVIRGVANTEIKLNSLILSKLGTEVLSLLQVVDYVETLHQIAPSFQIDGVNKISLFQYVNIDGKLMSSGLEECLWERVAS
jgi:hypothetical protein